VLGKEKTRSTAESNHLRSSLGTWPLASIHQAEITTPSAGVIRSQPMERRKAAPELTREDTGGKYRIDIEPHYYFMLMEGVVQHLHSERRPGS